jgi:hypothetical protein
VGVDFPPQETYDGVVGVKLFDSTLWEYQIMFRNRFLIVALCAISVLTTVSRLVADVYALNVAEMGD